MKRLLTRLFGTKAGHAGRGRAGGTRRQRAVRPGVLGLEGRQLMSGFARSLVGGSQDDMTVYRPSNGTFYSLTAGSGFNPGYSVQVPLGVKGDIPIQNSDFLGKGYADLAVFRPSNGTWYIEGAFWGGGAKAYQWGTQGDVPLAGSDFFGNGHADLAVWRPGNGTWYVKDPVTSQAFSVQWGQPGDVPIARADFDGDHRADIAVYRPSNQTWYVLTSSSDYTSRIVAQWGTQGDVPIPNSDFLGNGHDDFAVFRPSDGTWYVKDPIGGATRAFQWGQPGDVPIPDSDFFGDHRADFAVYRPSDGTWYVKDPLTMAEIRTHWGVRGDLPLADTDFDGDGKADLAVFRPMDDTWHVLTSSSNFAGRIDRQWGAAGDQAIPGPDSPDPIANIYGSTVNAPGAANVAGVEYASFLGNPLFATDGPTPTDVAQGQVGDCQTLSVLLGIAKDDPGVLRRMIFDMGDGNYAVDFKPLGVDRYVVVDATLPVNGNGVPIYAQLGHQGSLWVALLEKAWTFQRPTGGLWNALYSGTYHNIDGGGSAEVLGQMGLVAQTSNLGPTSGFGLWLTTVLDNRAGKLTTATTGTTVGGGLLHNHVYFVDAVNYGWVEGTWTATSVTLRNPHGGAEEFLTITSGVFQTYMVAVTSAYV